MKLIKIIMITTVSYFIFSMMTVEAGNAGASMYHEKCAMCHGSSGMAILPGAPNFARSERMEKPDNLLKKSVKNGLNAMPPFRGMLSDSQLTDIMAYIRKLRK